MKQDRVVLAVIVIGVLVGALALAGVFNTSPVSSAPLFNEEDCGTNCDEAWPPPFEGYIYVDWEDEADTYPPACPNEWWVTMPHTGTFGILYNVCYRYKQPGFGTGECVSHPYNLTVRDYGGSQWLYLAYTHPEDCEDGCEAVCTPDLALEGKKCGVGENICNGTFFYDDDEQIRVAYSRPCGGSYCETSLRWAIYYTTTVEPPPWFYPLVYSDTLDVTQGFITGTHNGVDFSVTEGRPVFAVYTGTVQATGWTDTRGFYIEIDHGSLPDGYSYDSHYYHLAGINVQPGDNVDGGCQIGWSGDTGVSTGPHLHLGIKQNDVWIDPLPLLELYPDSCRSDCEGIVNPEFITGTYGWDTNNVAWSESAYPNEGIVTLLGGGGIAQDVTISQWLTRTVHARVRTTAPDVDLVWMINGVIVGWSPIQGDGAWHVVGLDVAGTGVPVTLGLSNLPWPGYTIDVDWVCIGFTGSLGESQVDADCHLVNFDFSNYCNGWDRNRVSCFSGWAILSDQPDNYLKQTVTLANNVSLIQYMVRAPGGTNFNTYLGGFGVGYSVADSQSWTVINWVPDMAISGTVPFSLTNAGPNALEIDYICIYTEGQTQPPDNPFADCDEYWPGGDWFNIGKWVLWLWCMLQIWLNLIWSAILSIPSSITMAIGIVTTYLQYEFWNYYLWWSSFLVGGAVYGQGWIVQLDDILADLLLNAIVGVDILTTYFGWQLSHGWVPWFVSYLVGGALFVQGWLDHLATIGVDSIQTGLAGFGILTTYLRWEIDNLILWYASLIVGMAVLIEGLISSAFLWLVSNLVGLSTWLYHVIRNGITLGLGVLLAALLQMGLQLFMDLQGLIVGLAVLIWSHIDRLLGVLQGFLSAFLLGMGIIQSALTTLFGSFNDTATANLGLPDPENTSHPLYPIWIGIGLFDEVVADTPYQYLAVVAMAALGIRLIAWGISTLVDL